MIQGAPTQAGWGRRLLWLAGFFLVVVLLPAWLIEELAAQYEEEQGQMLALSDRDQARTLMARFDRSLDRLSIIERGLQRFRRQAVGLLRGRSLDEEQAQALQVVLHARFPPSSLLFWFDGQGRILQPKGSPAVRKRAAWQAFFRVIGGAVPAPANEEKIATNLIKSTFGEGVEPSYLRKGRRSTIPLLVEGEEHVLRILPLSAAGRPRSGHLLAIIPTGRARFGWELEFVTRRLTQAESRSGSRSPSRGDGAGRPEPTPGTLDAWGPAQQVGGYWRSREDGFGVGLLTPGFMEYIIRRLENGHGFYPYGEFLIHARSWSQDPDLVLVVAVRQSSRTARTAISIVRTVRGGVRAGAVVAAVFLLALGFGRIRPGGSLAARFRLGTFLLTGFPVLAMTIWGGNHLLNLSQQWEEETQKRLEGLLTAAEQHVAEGVSRTQEELLTLARSSKLLDLRTLEERDDVLKVFDPAGAVEKIYIPRSGPVQATVRNKVSAARVSQLLSLLKNSFLQNGFELDERLGQVPAEFASMLDRRSHIREFPVNQLKRIELGNEVGFLFSAYVHDQQRVPQLCLVLTFSFHQFCRHFLEEWLDHRRQEGSVFLAGLDAQGISRLPRNRRLRDLLEMIRQNEERIILPLEVRGKPYLALGRRLAGLATVGVAVLPFEEFSREFLLSLRFMAGFGLLVILVAWFLSDFLTFLMLKPVLDLAAAFQEVERGNLGIVLEVRSRDELGKLAGRFNHLVEGLRQKSRMLPFLSRDLVAHSQGESAVRIRRQRVAVSFSGLRRFGTLERRLAPEEAMKVMNEFLSRCEVCAHRWGGEIDKFLGDAAMAVFFEEEGKAPAEERAVRAALDLAGAVEGWNRTRQAESQETVVHGTGIAVGPVIGGHVGSLRKRLDFTVIGDTVNLAARLEKLAGAGGNPPILAVAEVFARPLEGIHPRAMDIPGVRGRVGPVQVVGVVHAE